MWSRFHRLRLWARDLFARWKWQIAQRAAGDSDMAEAVISGSGDLESALDWGCWAKKKKKMKLLGEKIKTKILEMSFFCAGGAVIPALTGGEKK